MLFTNRLYQKEQKTITNVRTEIIRRKNEKKVGGITMKCPICNNNLTYLQSEDDGIEFYECENCNKLIAVSDSIEEEE